MVAQSRIFFTRSYTYRKPTVLIGVLLALGFGGYALQYLVRTVPDTEWSLKAFGTAVFVGGIGGMLVVCGLVLLRRWFGGVSLRLEIAASGIQYGKVFHSWDMIHWLGGHRDRKRIQLVYQTRHRGLAGLDRPLPVEPNLTAEEYEELMQTLRNAIAPKYPDVIFG